MKKFEVGDKVWCADPNRDDLYQATIDQIVCKGDWAMITVNGRRRMVPLAYTFHLTERAEAVERFIDVLESSIIQAEVELEGFQQDVAKAEGRLNALKKVHADAVNELCKAGVDSGYRPTEEEPWKVGRE